MAQALLPYCEQGRQESAAGVYDVAQRSDVYVVMVAAAAMKRQKGAQSREVHAQIDR